MRTIFSASVGFYGLLTAGLVHAEKTAPVDPAVSAARIDQFIKDGHREQGIIANPGITDDQFVRRAYLDMAGRIPTLGELEAFGASSDTDKRETLIDQLLQSEGYVSHAYNYWADILRINTRLGNSGADVEAAYKLWVKDALRDNKPYDQFVNEMVSAQGLIWENGAVGYYQRDRGMPLDNMSNTVRIFLGTRLECAQCHNHPFDKWTQMDYFKMAAFSYNVDARGYSGPNKKLAGEWQRGAAKEAYEQASRNKDFPFLNSERNYKREVAHKNFEAKLERLGMNKKQFEQTWKKSMAAYKKTYDETKLVGRVMNDLYNPIQYAAVGTNTRTLQLPHDYQYDDARPKGNVAAGSMFGEELEFEEKADSNEKLVAYADWMTSEENPTFTRVIANRLWKRAFGVGVFEPTDEITDHTQVSNPALMAYLETLMKDLDYDMKAFLAVLYQTDLYQSAAHKEEIALGMPFYFPGPAMRRMTAEQIWDSVVSLAIDDSDHYLPGIASGLALVEKSRQIYHSLEVEPTKDEYMEMLKDLTAEARVAYLEQDKLRKAIYAASERGDNAERSRLSKKLGAVRSAQRKAMYERAYISVEKKIDGENLLSDVGMMAMSEMDGDAMMSGEAVPVITKLPKPEYPAMPEGLDRKQEKAWKSQMSSYSKGWNNHTRGLARASELPSPAPRGHFLREFGQSDRETIENSQQSASVPQALSLLNGSTSELLLHPFSVLGRGLAEAQTPTEEITLLYKAMLSREPRSQELEILLGEYEADPKQSRQSVLWALLNTQQFLFVD